MIEPKSARESLRKWLAADTQTILSAGHRVVGTAFTRPECEKYFVRRGRRKEAVMAE